MEERPSTHSTRLVDELKSCRSEHTGSGLEVGGKIHTTEVRQETTDHRRQKAKNKAELVSTTGFCLVAPFEYLTARLICGTRKIREKIFGDEV